MRRRFRDHGRLGFRDNPFVVFADMTIALAFIFAVHGLVTVASNSHAIEVAARLEKQNQLRDELLRQLQRVYPNTRVESKTNPGDSYPHSELLSNDGRWKTPVAEIWNNGNFQRLVLNGSLFRARESSLFPIGRKLYSSIAAHIKPRSADMSYLFVHGIVEPSEQLNSRDALALSRRRADDVYALMQQYGVVSPTAFPDATEDGEGKPCVPAKYAISFGTGDDLYRRNTPVGRVDLLLFYK